jgi:hypothetical protein
MVLRIHLCKHASTAFFIPFLLQNTISFHIFRVLVPVFPPVIRILLLPALLALLLIHLILWIILHFLALPKFFPHTLAIWPVTESMVLYPRIRNKETSAASIGTSDLLVHGFHPPGGNHNLIQTRLRMCRKETAPMEITAGCFVGQEEKEENGK